MTLATFEPKARAEPTGRGNREIADQMTEVVFAYNAADPRSQQRNIGLSEIGHPCPRKIAYKLAGMPEPQNPADDPWLMIIGTAVDAWIMQALRWQNEQLGRERFIVQRRVSLRPDKGGSLDIYDVDKRRVIDAKVVGKSSQDRYRKNGPSSDYRVQVHSYAQGMVNAGYPVDDVAIAFFPRFTWITKAMYVWSEPFDPAVPVAALERVDTVQRAVNALNPVQNPIEFTRFPRRASNCVYCPFYLPGDTDSGARCPGAK